MWSSVHFEETAEVLTAVNPITHSNFRETPAINLSLQYEFVNSTAPPPFITAVSIPIHYTLFIF